MPEVSSKDAVARAFVILDESQQTAARKLLQDHDVDLDDAAPAGSGGGASEEATPDNEP